MEILPICLLKSPNLILLDPKNEIIMIIPARLDSVSRAYHLQQQVTQNGDDGLEISVGGLWTWHATSGDQRSVSCQFRGGQRAATSTYRFQVHILSRSFQTLSAPVFQPVTACGKATVIFVRNVAIQDPLHHDCCQLVLVMVMLLVDLSLNHIDIEFGSPVASARFSSTAVAECASAIEPSSVVESSSSSSSSRSSANAQAILLAARHWD